MYSTGISSTLGASHVEVLAAALLRPAVMSMHFCAFLLWFFGSFFKWFHVGLHILTEILVQPLLPSLDLKIHTLEGGIILEYFLFIIWQFVHVTSMYIHNVS